MTASYEKATPFLPLADLLRVYFKIDARDVIRGIRVKVTGGLLTLNETLRDEVHAALWLLDALPEDSPLLKLEPGERRRRTIAAVKCILLRENQLHPLLLVFEDLHWIDSETQAFLDNLVDSLPATRTLGRQELCSMHFLERSLRITGACAHAEPSTSTFCGEIKPAKVIGMAFPQTTFARVGRVIE